MWLSNYSHAYGAEKTVIAAGSTEDTIVAYNSAQPWSPARGVVNGSFVRMTFGSLELRGKLLPTGYIVWENGSRWLKERSADSKTAARLAKPSGSAPKPPPASGAAKGGPPADDETYSYSCVAPTCARHLRASQAPTHAHAPTTAPNMNGAYELSKTPGAPTGASFPTNFKDYPGGVESFDVYHGPITTQYSQIWWASTSNPLPEDIVRRFDGKAIAIVGLEMDQVRRTPQGDVPVPINVAYNHHHDTAVVGKGSHLVEVERDDPRFVKAGR